MPGRRIVIERSAATLYSIQCTRVDVPAVYPFYIELYCILAALDHIRMIYLDGWIQAAFVIEIFKYQNISPSSAKFQTETFGSIARCIRMFSNILEIFVR